MLKDYFNINESTIIKKMENSDFPHTSKALMNYYFKSRSSDNVVQAINFDLDFYPCLILIRSQIEHYIVASYIWIQHRIKENDEIAKLYYEEYLLFEVIKRLKYAESNNINMSNRYSILFKKILDILSKKKVIVQKDLDILNSKVKQFDIKKISRFFDENLPLEYDNILKPERYKEFLEYYNYYSSFVHGGPSADIIMNEPNKTRFVKKATECIEWSANIVAVHRFFIIYFLAMHHKEYETILTSEIEKMIKTGV